MNSPCFVVLAFLPGTCLVVLVFLPGTCLVVLVFLPGTCQPVSEKSIVNNLLLKYTKSMIKLCGKTHIFSFTLLVHIIYYLGNPVIHMVRYSCSRRLPALDNFYREVIQNITICPKKLRDINQKFL